ncbi:PHD finger-like domain-containing protein 5A [Nibea albiflora]|uniref:PHD finger-like domain-containing protein 5A n=1 Tax=Nibea albiflora TaxID=240163 RepID=A0ACB7F3C8_NIBAL|nr:PHD finger-like domain-containing protein 5A [Nibea albiflora]
MAKHHPDLIFCRKQAGVGDGKCVICDSYVRPCTLRDGCPKIVNLGSSKTDLFYERKKYGFKKR